MHDKNHRITKLCKFFYDIKRPVGLSSPMPCSKQRSWEQVAQDYIQLRLEHLYAWRRPSLLATSNCLSPVMMKKCSECYTRISCGQNCACCLLSLHLQQGSDSSEFSPSPSVLQAKPSQQPLPSSSIPCSSPDHHDDPLLDSPLYIRACPALWTRIWTLHSLYSCSGAENCSHILKHHEAHEAAIKCITCMQFPSLQPSIRQIKTWGKVHWSDEGLRSPPVPFGKAVTNARCQTLSCKIPVLLSSYYRLGTRSFVHPGTVGSLCPLTNSVVSYLYEVRFIGDFISVLEVLLLTCLWAELF